MRITSKRIKKWDAQNQFLEALFRKWPKAVDDLNEAYKTGQGKAKEI